MDEEQLNQARSDYQAGKRAFERGNYRQSVQLLEKAVSVLDSPTRLGGEMQIWLVTAYQANGQQDEAIALCRQLSRHPDYETAKQGKRLLYILEAPKLRTRPEWVTPIPDLASLDEAGESDLARKIAANRPTKPRSPRTAPAKEPTPIDPSLINTRDNRFIWVALVAIALLLLGLLWFS